MASDNTQMRGGTISKLILVAAWATAAHALWKGNAIVLPPQSQTPPPAAHRFTLRHIVQHVPQVKVYNISAPEVQTANLQTQDDGEEDGVGPYIVRSSTTTIERLIQRTIPDVQDLLSEARYFGRAPILPQSAWTLDEVPSPNVTDRETVINFALMAANAYNAEKRIGDWEDPTPPFNHSSSFGWKGDTLRGHVFANEDNSTIVLSIKGTSPAVFDGVETTTNDKINDNLFFSCCCGQGGQFFWRQVCSCMTSSYTCNQTCLVTELKKPQYYYSQVIELYGNVTEYYPDSNIWLTGHSLGGATASLLGLTFGIPVMTFEAVPEALPAARLGLPVPPGTKIGTHQRRQYTGAYHFGHTADPVFMGTCNGAALCTVGGYAMQSQCHTGNKCTWNTVADKKWRQSLTRHGIRSCIDDVYRDYDSLPECSHDSECVDCYTWNFFESNQTESTTSQISSTETTRTRTRTETCQTPGWWGCKDGSTTTTTTNTATVITSSTTTVITETCKSYGWFGRCLDPTPTTTTITSTIPVTTTVPIKITTPPASSPSLTPSTSSATNAPSSTSTCQTPGFFWGCYDEETTTTTMAPSSRPMTTSSTSTCQTPGIFWGCYDEDTTTTATMTSSTPGTTSSASTSTSTTASACKTPGLFWGCWDEKITSAGPHGITPAPKMAL